MASAFAHGLVGVLAGWTWARGRKPWDFWVLSAVVAIAPDADVVSFALGIDYLAFFGHRGFSHSIVFALLFGPFVTAVLYRRAPLGSRAFWGLSLHFAACTASHGVLDMLTDGGEGVALLSPFSTERLFFPFRPVVVSPIGAARFFSPWGLAVVKSELLWIAAPALALAVVARTGVSAALRRRAVAPT